MKKLFFSLLAVLSLSLITACGNSANKGTNNPTLSPEDASIIATGVPEDRIIDVITWDDNYTVCEDTISFINDVKTYDIKHNIDPDACTDKVTLECVADKDMNEYKFTMEITFTYSESYWSRTGDIQITSESKNSNPGYTQELTTEDIYNAIINDQTFSDALPIGGITFYFKDLLVENVTIKSKTQTDDTTLTYLVGLEMYNQGNYLNVDIYVDFYYHANEDKWMPASMYKEKYIKYTPTVIGKWVGTGTDGNIEGTFEIEVYDDYNVETYSYNTGRATFTTASGTYEYLVEAFCDLDLRHGDITTTFSLYECVSDPNFYTKFYFVCKPSGNTLEHPGFATFTRQ